jgi:hypothetical protein
MNMECAAGLVAAFLVDWEYRQREIQISPGEQLEQ